MSENRPFDAWTPGFKASDVPIVSNPTPLGIPVPGAGNFQDLPPEVFGGLGKTTAISDSRSDAEFVEDDAAEGFRVKEAGGGICAECQLTPPDGGSATGGAHGCHCC